MIIIGLLFLSFFWLGMFPFVLDFENRWNERSGESLGLGPLIPVLMFGIIWTLATGSILLGGIRGFLSMGGSQTKVGTIGGISLPQYHETIIEGSGMKICETCGVENLPSDSYCANCGENLNW